MNTLTTAEKAQLITLREQADSAHDQAESDEASARLFNYCERLRVMGRGADQVIAVLYP